MTSHGVLLKRIFQFSDGEIFSALMLWLHSKHHSQNTSGSLKQFATKGKVLVLQIAYLWHQFYEKKKKKKKFKVQFFLQYCISFRCT